MSNALKTTRPTAEAFVALGKPRSIDREKGIAAGVRIINPDSKNGSTYPPGVLDRAKTMYEGAKVNLNHGTSSTQDTPIENRFGRIRNVRPTDTGGLEGDLYYNPKHPFAEQFVWAAKNQPDLYGFSHYARVNWRANSDGTRTAESIVYVYHVDLVADPATTNGVFESQQDKPMELDAKAVAALITDAATLDKFLNDLFAALPSSIDTAARMAAVEKMMVAMDATDVAPTGESVAIESLKRRGKAAQWAASVVESDRREKAVKAKREQAVSLCKAEGLPDSLMQDVFVELVAESIDNSVRAKALIADRRALHRPGTNTPGTGDPISPPPPPPSAKKSVKDLVGEYTR
jgi:hypothetical protein